MKQIRAALFLLCFGAVAATAHADGNEPNNTPGDATPAAIGVAVHDAIKDREDRDWYRVEIPSGGDLYAYVEDAQGNYSLVEVRFHDSEGNHLGDFSVWAESGGVYLVEVRAYQDPWMDLPGSYELVLEHYPASGYDQDDSYSGDPYSEDSYGGAVPLAVGEVIDDGYDAYGVPHAYALPVDGVGLLLVTLSIDGRSVTSWSDALMPVIFDGDTEWSTEDGIATDRDGRTWHGAAIASGEARISIETGDAFPWDGGAVGYRLETMFLPGALELLEGPLGCPERPVGIGPDATAPVTMEPGITVACQAVEIPVAGRLMVTATAAIVSGYSDDPDLSIAADWRGIPVAYGDAVTGMVPPGRYILMTRRYDYNAEARQQFLVTNRLVETPPTEPVPQVSLTPDQPRVAVPLAADSQGESTRLQIEIAQPGTLTATVLGGPSTGLEIKGVDDGWWGQLPAQVNPGRYELAVRAYEPWPWPYQILLTLYPGTDPCEPNDSENLSCGLRLAQPQALSLSSFSDIDWFHVEVDEPGLVAIVLDGLPEPQLDGSGNLVSGLAADLWFDGRTQSSGHVAHNRAWGLLGYLDVKRPGTYRFGVSGNWYASDPLTPLSITALRFEPDADGDTAVFAMGSQTPTPDRLELAFLAALSQGRFAELLSGEALEAAVEAFVQSDP